MAPDAALALKIGSAYTSEQVQSWSESDVSDFLRRHGMGEYVQEFREQPEPKSLLVNSDTDHAGDVVNKLKTDVKPDLDVQTLNRKVRTVLLNS